MNQKSFTTIPLSQDTTNSVHRLVQRNQWGLYIQDRYQRPFLEDEGGTQDNPDNSTYSPSDRKDSKYGDDSNERDYNNDTNINPPPPTVKWHRGLQE